jgi:Arc/MetJ-type ribon-helix-helix transcriptional regulator
MGVYCNTWLITEEFRMARKTKVISISVPEKLAEDLDRMAEEEGVSKSELVRLMARSYRRERVEARFLELQRKMAPKAREMGIHTEEDVDRIVFEDR